MKLQSTIRRDGVKVHYLHDELIDTAIHPALARRKKNLLFRVGKVVKNLTKRT